MKNNNENLKEYFDHDALIERLGGNDEIVDMLMQTFFESTADDLQTLKIVIKNGNAQEVSEVAHKIKGRILNMSVSEKASDAAKLLELDADKMSEIEMIEQLTIIENIFLQIKKLYKN